MSIATGFIILAEDRNKLTDELISFLESKNDKSFILKKEGVFPKDFFKKNSHFIKNEKDKLKIFIEVSSRGTIFHYMNKKSAFDLKTFDELNEIINKNGNNDLYLFPFEVNGGIQKKKPRTMLNSWKGKLI